jgi:hypothetical protein
LPDLFTVAKAIARTLKERRPDNTVATLFVFKLASGFVARTTDKIMECPAWPFSACSSDLLHRW